jgi:hypothetical protein
LNNSKVVTFDPNVFPVIATGFIYNEYSSIPLYCPRDPPTFLFSFVLQTFADNLSSTMAIDPSTMYPPGVAAVFGHPQQQQQRHQGDPPPPPPPVPQDMMRSYFVPNNLPTRPTDEE